MFKTKFYRPKAMVIERDVIPSTHILFKEMRNNFTFKPVADDRYAYVAPYIVIIDGQDVLASISEDGSWVVGFAGVIEKPSWWVKKGPGSFDAIVGKAVSKIFLDTYETSLAKGDYSILCTSRAVYSLDKRVALPICWLVIPNDRPVGLKSKKGEQITPLSIKECFEGGLAIQSKNYLTSLVGNLVAANDIELPMFSYKSSMHPDL
jgi:hypothetical protein